MKKFAGIAVAAVAMAGWAAPARADVFVYASTDGINYTLACSDVGAPTTDPVCANSSFTVGTVTVKVQGAEANQVPGQSQLLSSATSLTNNSTSTANVYLQILGTGYTAPVGTGLLTSQIGGSVTTGSANNVLSYTSCVSSSNDATCSQSSATLSPNITQNSSSYNASTASTVTGLASPFALVENIHFTLGSNAKLGYQASTTLTPVPEPASTALFGLGLLGVARSVRRRLGKRA